MDGFLIKTVVSAALLYFMSRMIDGVEIRGVVPALIGAVVLGLLNALVMPLLTLLALPLIVLTLGLFFFVLNAVGLMVTAWIVPGFSVRGFGSALIGSLVLGLMHFVVNMVFG